MKCSAVHPEVCLKKISKQTLIVVINNNNHEQWRIQCKRLGGYSQIGWRQKGLHLLKYQRLSATIVVCHT